MRVDGRKYDQLRKLKFHRGFLKFAAGSCLVEMGNTKVICSASVEDKVPFFVKKDPGRGWITAEYGMLPASCTERVMREASKGKPSGRTQEIQRLIGRSLRAVADLGKLGERTVWLDADVVQGDGGTRTAAISGCYVALVDALTKLRKKGILTEDPLTDAVAAVSVGMVEGAPVLDLCYREDLNAEVDMNVVMTGSGRLIEVQGTAEHKPFSRKDLNAMLALAEKGIAEIIRAQKKILA